MIDSDGFFDLEIQPKKVGVIGAGYIAVELAGVFNGLGSDTSMFVRYIFMNMHLISRFFMSCLLAGCKC